MEIYHQIWHKCCHLRGVCLTVMAVPLFISVYILISLNLDNISDVDQSPRTREAKVYVHSIIRMQRAIDDLNSDLSRVTLHRDFLIGQISKFINFTEKNGNSNHLREIKLLFDLPLMIQEHHFETFESLVHSDYLLSCDQINAVHYIGNSLRKNDYATIQFGFYGFQEVFIVKRANLIKNCPRDFQFNDCVDYGNYQLMKEILLLQQLEDASIVRLLGVCVTMDTLPASVSYVVEGGSPVNITYLLQQAWNKRVTILKNVVLLIEKLQRSSLGHLGVRPVTQDTFLQVTGGWVKLADIGVLVSGDPSCHSQTDCFVAGMDVGVHCDGGECQGLTSKQMLHFIHQHLMRPLLSLPPPHRASQAASLMRHMRGGKLVIGEVVSALEALKVGGDTVGEEVQRARRVTKPSSSSLHQSVPGQEDEDEDTLTWPGGPDVYKFRRMMDTDLPSQFDYQCPRSQSSWGCVFVVHSMQEALTRCTGDPQCRAFVIVQHQDREDWLTITMKNGYGDVEKAEGSMLYIKHPVESIDDDVPSKIAAWREEEVDDNDFDPTLTLQPCLDELFQMQINIRSHREKHLLSSLGLFGLTELQWEKSVQTGGTTGVSEVDQPPGQKGGRILLHMDASMIKSALFLAEDGPTHYHLAHLAFHHLDRILGLYRTSPSTLRQLTPSDLDLLSKLMPSSLDQFSHLISQNKQLTGVLTMPLVHKAGRLKRLKLLPLRNMTSVIMPMSEEGYAQLEYIILLWLSGTARQTNNFLQYKGKPIHLISDDAFHQGVDSLLNFFNHCQFPQHTVEVLWNLQQSTDHCTLASQMFYQLHQNGVSPADMKLHFKSNQQVALLVNRAAEKLLQVVDRCINKFGKGQVLYQDL